MSHVATERCVVHAALRGLRWDPELLVDEWAERHMILPKSAAFPGPYRIDRTPQARRILQCLSPGHPAKRVVVRGASQMLKTQIALNWIGGSMHLAPANIIALQPTESLVKRFAARVNTTVRDVQALRAIVRPARSRDSRNTTHAKDFEGGTLYIATGGAAANLAEIPARYVLIDEVDRLLASVDGEGDPIELAEARATTFQNTCKFLEVSSPTVAGASKIDLLFDMGTREHWHVPCPHCGHEHELVVENFKHQAADYDDALILRAWFVCPHCGAEIEQRHKPEIMAAGRWVAESAGDGETVSFQVSAFGAPAGSITWLSLARQYHRALERLQRNDPDGMQVFWNTRLALSYNNTQGGSTVKKLQDRAEPYPPRVLPDPALVVTIAVDTQINRLEVQAEAWGPGMEHWVLDHQVLWGSPADLPEAENSVWSRLDEYRRTPFLHASGSQIPASVYGIDSGGANTQDVYNYGAGRNHMGCLILKGASRPNRPIISNVPSKVDIDHNGTKIADGALLWLIGTDVAKDWLHNRWSLSSGPGAMHFPATGLHDRWFEQVLAERPQLKRAASGHMRRSWYLPPGLSNEALDLSSYNLALAHHLGLHKWSALDWQHLRSKIVPAATAVAAAPAAPPLPLPAPPASAPIVRKRRMLSSGV
jgi:phage terminase large subunit GpA-like protein